MIFSLDVRPARKGDCLLLHYGSAQKPGLVMIDGGPKSVYGPHLKPRLLAVRKARGLDAQTPLSVDLLMVSHVDDDHIQGILDMTRELREASGVPFVHVRRMWHNSFDDLIGNDPKELTSSVAAHFGSAALTGDLPDGASVDADNVDQEEVVSTIKVLASIAQGHRLRLDAEALNIPLNPQFEGKLILAAARDVPVTGGLTLTVAGPMQPELVALQQQHDEWLKQLKAKGLTPEQALAAYVDESVPNLSSIVVLAKAADKTILLTGDARGDKILEGLELARALAEQEPLARLLGREVAPADERLDSYVRLTMRNYFHPAGTCGIGRVVDDSGRVLGVDRLFIADASIMPTIPRANTNLTTVAVAERLAELI